MALDARLLAALADVWPSPVRARNERIGAQPGTDEFARGYTIDQFMQRVRSGVALGMLMPPLWGKTVLEIGCGHGGITCWLASLGAKKVVGIDLNVSHVRYGEELAQEIAARAGREKLPVEFREMDATALAFPAESFDVVWADNCFEHFTEPERVLREASRVLVPGGLVLVPSFSSIRSKYGLHLKLGLKMPWLNLLFDEGTIVEALQRRAKSHPELYEWYPGLRGEPKRVRDVRRHGDLNDITHARFREMAEANGFTVKHFTPHATRLGRVLVKLAPRLAETPLLDVLSTGAAAVLEKRA